MMWYLQENNTAISMWSLQFRLASQNLALPSTRGRFAVLIRVEHDVFT